jgi:multidrug resistance efflux pump
MSNQSEPGKEALIYDPSTVSWAVADAVARPPAVLARLGLYLIVLVVAAAGAYAWFARVAVTVTGRGIIRTTGKVRPVRALSTGKIAQLHVANGRKVKKGDPLVEMEDNLAPRELERANRIIASVNKLLASGEGRQTTTDAGVLAQEPLRLSGPVLVRERSALAEALNAYFQALRSMHDSTPELSRADVSERQTAMAKIDKIRSQHLEEDLRNELQELEKTAARLSVSIRDRQEQARRAVAAARGTLEVQIRTFEEALRSQTTDLTVRAPVDGIVSNLKIAGVGELLTAGQALFELIPEDGKLTAEVEIANKDIAELRLSMPVKVKLDAYPFQDYGTLDGTLAELPEDVSPGEKGAPPSYIVQIALARETMPTRKGDRPIKLGMTLSADIEIRRRTLLELAVVEVLKLKDVF